MQDSDSISMKQNAMDVHSGKITWSSVSGQFAASGKSMCFHGDGVVETNLGQMKMSDLASMEPADLLIRTVDSDGHPTFSKIQQWIHKDPVQVTEFITLGTNSGRSLTLTPNHLIYKVPCEGEVNRIAVVAGAVLIDDCVLINREGSVRPDRVVSIETSLKTGIFSPITAEGNIVVDGVLASCYSNVDSEGLQKYMIQYITATSEFMAGAIPESWHRLIFGGPGLSSLPEVVSGFLEVSKLWVA